MKSWKTLLGLGLGSLTLVACTITTGSDSDDDDGNDGRVLDVGEEPVDETEDSGTTTEDPPDETEVDAGEMMTEDPVGDPDFVCDTTADDACEACLANFCCQERADCAANGTCLAEWDAIKSCMDDKDLMSNPAEDNQAEVDDCASQAAPNGNVIELSDEAFALTDCLATDYEEMMASADAGTADGGEGSGLVEGDDLCTLACYGVFSTNPVDVDFDQNE